MAKSDKKTDKKPEKVAKAEKKVKPDAKPKGADKGLKKKGASAPTRPSAPISSKEILAKIPVVGFFSLKHSLV